MVNGLFFLLQMRINLDRIRLVLIILTEKCIIFLSSVNLLQHDSHSCSLAAFLHLTFASSITNNKLQASTSIQKQFNEIWISRGAPGNGSYKLKQE